MDRFVPYISNFQLDAARRSAASPLLFTTVPSTGADLQLATANEQVDGFVPCEPGSGSAEDPNLVPPPPAPPMEDEGSDNESIESFQEATHPDISEREKELRRQAHSREHAGKALLEWC